MRSGKVDTGLVGRKRPVHGSLHLISCPLPRGHTPTHCGCIRKATTERLPGEHGLLNLRHVHPAAVGRRVMDLQPLGQALHLRRREGLIQTADAMRVQVVHHEHNGVDLRILLIEHRA